MTRQNRLLALVLVVCLLGSSLISVSAQETTATAALYETETEFMQACGILKSTVNAGMPMSRAAFTRLVVEVLYPQADFSAAQSGETPLFEDVTNQNSNYSYLKVAKDLKIITGDPYNYFYPDRNITYIEAIAITVNALCYTVYANARGGYPTGYYDIAREIKLLADIDLSYDTEINGSTAVKLIYNAMFADMVVISSLTQGVPSFEINKNSNLMKERYDITEYKAVVIDDGFVSLTGDSIADDERVVLSLQPEGEDLAVYVGDTDISKQLGSTIHAYVKDNQQTGRRELVYYAPYAQASDLWVSSEWIQEQDDSKIEFERIKDSGKVEKASFRNPSILVDGVRYLKPFSTLDLSNSLIRFVDGDDNHDYEFILVYQFGAVVPRTIIVDKVTAEDDEFYLGCRLNPAKSLKGTDNDSIVRIVYGNPATLADIPVGSVVSVAQSAQTIGGKTLYFLAVSEATAEGEVESVGLSGDELTIGGVLYPVSASYLSVKSEGYIKRLAAAGSVKCLLDVMGNVAFVESESVALKQYAYLIGAEVQTLDDVLKVKLFDPVEKTIVVMNLRGSTTIDGKACKGAAAQLARLQERPAGFAPLAGAPSASEYISRPVIWKYNADKEITLLDTDTPNSQNNPSYTTVTNGSLNLNTTMTPINYSTTELEDEDALKASLRIMREGTHTYSPNISSVSGKFYVTKDTELIGVPEIDTIGMKELDSYSGANADNYSYEEIKAYEKPISDENYIALTIADLMDKRYDMQAYDVDPVTGVAGLVVVRGRESFGNYSWNDADMAIFLRSTEVYNEATDGLITRVYYTYDGEKEEYADFDFDNMLGYYKDLVYGNKAKGITPVKKGDIIRVGLVLGKANHIERVVNIADIKDTTPLVSYPYGVDIAYQKNNTSNPFYVTTKRNWPLNSTYVLCTGYIGDIQGSSFSMVTSASSGYSGQPLHSIDLTDPTTYAGMYSSFEDAEFSVTTINKDGSVDVKKGDLSDVVSYTANGNNLEGTSIVMFYYAKGDISQMRVINDLRTSK